MNIDEQLQSTDGVTDAKSKAVQNQANLAANNFKTMKIKLKYFTRFVYLEPYKPLLNKFQLLMLTLIHLQLNLPHQLLTYQFNRSVEHTNFILEAVILPALN